MRQKLKARPGDRIPDPEGDGEVEVLLVNTEGISYRHPHRGVERKKYADLTITEWARIKNY